MTIFALYPTEKDRIQINPDGIPVSPLSYWDSDILAGIAAAPRHEEPDPEPHAPQPDWTGFNLAISADPYWQSWNIPADLRGALITTAIVEIEGKFKTAYQTATAIVPPSPEAVASWQQVAAQFHIPLTF